MEKEMEEVKIVKIVVNTEGLKRKNQLSFVKDSYAIKRRLTLQESEALNTFLDLLNFFEGKEVELRHTSYGDHYDTFLYNNGNRLLVRLTPMKEDWNLLDPTTYRIDYRYSICPKNIIKGHNFSHKDICFVWSSDREPSDVLELDREFHGIGNGSYYLYSLSNDIVFRKEDD